MSCIPLKKLPLKLVNIIGAPSVGKSVLAAETYSYAASLGISSHLVTEFVKDWALRKISISPINQLAVVGQQSHLITALLKNNFSLAVSDTSLLLAAFYANYYSNNSFLNLILAIKEWELYLASIYEIRQYNFFIHLTEKDYKTRYNSDGRYETFEECLLMQDALEAWFYEHGSVIKIGSSECNAQHILKHVDLEIETYGF